MNKCHTNINWVNDTTPAINDTNLNYMDGCIDTIDDRVISLDTTKANQSDLLTAMADWNVDNATGDVTITLKNGQTITRHTNLGKIAINVRVIHDPTDPHYQEMEITMPDGTKDYVDFSAFVTQFEFVDSSEIHASVNSDGEVSFSLINGSITGAKLQPNYLADVTAQATIASNAATTSNANQLLSEGYANGTQGGVPVSSSSPYYHNNAKYWKEQAQSIAGGSISGLSDVSIVNPQDGQVLTYDGSNHEWVNGDTSPGILPHIIVISETGATVTLTKGLTVISATETSTGHFEADVPEYGTWVIDSILSGDDAQASLVVDAVKIYTIDDKHFYAAITVTYSPGAIVSCSMSGETTLYATESPYTFTVRKAGTWTIAAAYTPATFSENVVITTNGQTESVDLTTTTTFAGIHRVVSGGYAEDFFEIGDQIEVTYTATDNTEYTMPFDIVHFDTVELADGTTHPGMFLQSHYGVIEEVGFDAAEPANANTHIRGNGYNRWSESGMRAWLNSSEAVGGWWSNNFERGGLAVTRRAEDVAPSLLSSINGFMRGLPADFVSVLGNVKVQTLTNTVTDGGVTDVTHDTFFLPSIEQIYCIPEVSGVEGDYWEYWKDRLGLSTPATIDVAYAGYTFYELDNHLNTTPIFFRSARRNYPHLVYRALENTINAAGASDGTKKALPACVIV